MNQSAILKRIENVETQLTPKEWAVRLADTIRNFPSEDEFHDSILGYASADETPFMKPFFALKKQAEKRQPGNTPDDEDTQNRMSRKLRAEYQALKLLIFQCNEKMTHKADIWRLRASLQLSNMMILALQDIVEMQGVKINGKDIAEHKGDFGFSSITEDWRPKTLKLIAEFFLFDAVVKAIQDKYFDGHSILFRDLEDRLSAIKAMIDHVIVTFNDYLKALEGKIIIQTQKEKGEIGDKAESLKLLTLDSEKTKKHFDQKSILAGAEAWAKDAKDKATVDIIDEMGRCEEAKRFLWNLAKEQTQARKTENTEFDSNHIVSE